MSRPATTVDRLSTDRRCDFLASDAGPQPQPGGGPSDIARPGSRPKGRPVKLRRRPDRTPTSSPGAPGRALRRLLVVAGVVLALVAAIGVTPASAGTATLTIYVSNCETSDGRIHDYLARSEVVFARYHPAGTRVVFTVWGSDTWSDDRRFGPADLDPLWSEVYAGSRQRFDLCLDSSTLNEDWGTDEIYIVFEFRDATSVEKATTPVVSGSF